MYYLLTKNNDIEYAGSFATVPLDNGFDPTRFEDELSFDIRSIDHNDMEVEIHGIDAPLANTLRRIIISEVFLYNEDTHNGDRQSSYISKHFYHP